MHDKTPAAEYGPGGVTEGVPWHVTDVRALPPHTLAVRFADGTQGKVNLSRLAFGNNPGIFTALRDPAFFARAAAKDGVVTWPGDLDLAPDAMYDAIRAHGQWTPE